MGASSLRIVFWGTYDLSKPRTRILLDGLRAAGASVEELHAPTWESVRDKSLLSHPQLIGRLLRTAFAYPKLMRRFLAAPKPDAVIVGYMGQLDVLLIAPLARLRGTPVVWDQFLSLFDAVVHDRRQLSAHHPLALALYLWEWLACRAADCVLLDTSAHASHIGQLFGLSSDRVRSVWVGAETTLFPRLPPRVPSGALNVLFYGQLIPLHGIRTIVEAARLLREQPVRFLLIGSGQEEGLLRQLLLAEPLLNLEWLPWVDYEKLIECIQNADVCLGIFGTTGKAAHVVPNKVYQVIAAGRPLVTRDSPAIREVVDLQDESVVLVPAGDAAALAAALLEFAQQPGKLARASVASREAIGAGIVGKQLAGILEDLVARRRGRNL